MSKERNDLFVVIIFSLIWIVRPISYDEMRSRHPIYPQEMVINISNQQTGVFDEKSIFEAEGGLQGEVEGLYSNLRRTNNPKVDLDFEATSVQTGQTIFVDHKGMIDFASLADKGIDTSGFPTHESVAFNMGKDSVDQKERFIGLDKGPKSRDDVLHLYNFKDIRNNAEKPFLVQAVLNGAEQAGYTDGIRFLNYE